MTTFDQREDAFEKRYAHDEELVFKAHARRTQKLGAWAASLLGKTGPDAQIYAQDLLTLEIAGGGEDAIARRVAADLAAGGVAKSEHQVRQQMDAFMIEAQHEVRTA